MKLLATLMFIQLFVILSVLVHFASSIDPYLSKRKTKIEKQIGDL